MDDVQKMFQIVVNGQSAMKSELLAKIEGLDKKIDGVEERLTKRIDGLDKKIDGVEERLTKRIDKIGLTVANLEDDAPTRDEFDDLEARMKKVELKIVN